MLKFNRVKQQNFYVHEKQYGYRILKSYNTIVGLIYRGTLYETKYSRTTSKQVTQYCDNLPYYDCVTHKVIVDSQELARQIKLATGLDIDTRYNCA